MLEDDLRELFAEEAEMRLGRLAEQLLELEDAAGDEELVASVFRDAHTIKGSAAVVGLPDVARVAHAMEDILEGFRNRQREPTANLVDGLLRAVDGLRAVMPRVLAGEDAGADLLRLESDLRALDAGALPPAQSAPAAPTREPAAQQDGDPPSVDESDGARTDLEGSALVAASTERRADTEVVRVAVARLDELVRLVSESATASLKVRKAVADRLGSKADFPELDDLSRVLTQLHERTMQARMVPVASAVEPVRRAVRELSRSQGKDVRWEMRGGETELDRGVLDQLGDALIQLVRNAIDHGIEPADERARLGKPIQATIRLHAMQLGSEVVLAVTDDGQGIDLGRIRDAAARGGVDTTGLSDEETLELAFGSGVSTATTLTEVSGRGVGLDVVRAALRAVRGRVEIHSTPGAGAEFRMIVPITLAVLGCMIVAVGAGRYAIPMHSIVTVGGPDDDRTQLEGKPALWVDDLPVAVTDLAAVLGESSNPAGPSVTITSLAGRHAFQVDALIGERDVVVKGLPDLLPRLDVIAGASVEPDGSILAVLDPMGLVERVRRGDMLTAIPRVPADAAAPEQACILVVDDALTVRELQRAILQRAGYRVLTAGDGVEALEMLGEHRVDLVLTDIEMPRLGGFELTEAIRTTPDHANTAIVILTSRADDNDRRRGLEAGADGYIVKAGFDEGALLEAVARALGRPS